MSATEAACGGLHCFNCDGDLDGCPNCTNGFDLNHARDCQECRDRLDERAGGDHLPEPVLDATRGWQPTEPMPPMPPPPDDRDAPPGRDRAASAAAAVRVVELPAIVRLDEFLDQPDRDVDYRIDGLWPADGRVLMAAQYKAGKTTAIGNLLRSWVDLEPFLGRYHVSPPDGGIVLLDDELHPDTLRKWLREQSIAATDQVHLASLRGRTASFNILDDDTRAIWAKLLAATGAKAVMLDCLRPVIDALGLSEDKDTGKVLEAFDALLAEAGISEAVIAHHMGHAGERSRGDSRLRDWPDAEWRIVRDGDSPDSPRYFSAYGRDVDQPEQLVNLDGRHLVVAGGSRREAALAEALDAVLGALDGVTEPMSTRQVEGLVAPDTSRQQARDALDLGVRDGLIVREDGPRRAKLHRLADPPSAPVRGSAPPVRQRSGDECASAPIGRRTAQSGRTPASAPGWNDCTNCDRRTFGSGLCRDCQGGAEPA